MADERPQRGQVAFAFVHGFIVTRGRFTLA
jgi:hypothetical protein